MTMVDPFTRTVDAIDRELHDQVERRDAGTAELLHAVFVIERASLVIDRLIEERLKAAEQQTVTAS